jgi:hypothetical protein
VDSRDAAIPWLQEVVDWLLDVAAWLNGQFWLLVLRTANQRNYGVSRNHPGLANVDCVELRRSGRNRRYTQRSQLFCGLRKLANQLLGLMERSMSPKVTGAPPPTDDIRGKAVSTVLNGSTSSEPCFAGGVGGTIVVRDLKELRSLSRSLQSAPRKISIRIPGLEPAAVAAWESGLNESLPECGCTLGRQCAQAALICTLAWAVGQGIVPRVVRPRMTLRMAVLMTASAAAGGKVLGISLARARVAHVIDEIEQRLADRGPGTKGRDGWFVAPSTADESPASGIMQIQDQY